MRIDFSYMNPVSLSGFRLVAQAFEPVLQGTQARKPVPRKQTLSAGSCIR
ncbi:hypothetical protein FTUN_6664 [Frigoriglobus tundricola]|uniref:Uncharacterized protein n=1 Tax=Frigoriglobus tundricola TaxID=2774151 RepID=A0A6M5Z035_9BACT|nr:hypothetical protein FTUN_6664 [Frigoriglobus tundricola]